MAETLYYFLRGAAGFSFLVTGASFLFEPHRPRVHRAFGVLFMALGLVFLLSWLSEYWVLPLVFDNLLLISIVFAISQSLFEITLFLFGDESVKGSRRAVYKIGAAWSTFLWLLPLLDLLFRLPRIGISVEDGTSMGLFQSISSTAVYAWPIAITVFSFHAGRWHLADIPSGRWAGRALLLGFAGLVVILGIIAAGLLMSSRALYQAGHTVLELMMLVWFFFYRARPDVFLEARKEIGQRHKQREKMGSEEASRIASRLRHLVEVERVCVNPELDLKSLAKAVRVPSYRLSAYFNSSLNQSFPEWLNAMRIEIVCRLLSERPDLSILEVSIEAGYASKTVFNGQFQRRIGMSPSEYRNRIAT